MLKVRFFACGAAVCTYAMERLAVCHGWLKRHADNAGSDFAKLISLLVSFPVFQANHFFFKAAYRFNQRRLRLLCSEDFFLQFYNWPAPGSEDTELGVLMGLEVRHGEAEVHARVQA